LAKQRVAREGFESCVYKLKREMILALLLQKEREHPARLRALSSIFEKLHQNNFRVGELTDQTGQLCKLKANRAFLLRPLQRLPKKRPCFGESPCVKQSVDRVLLEC
jgi:hypothetical protein